MHRRMAKYRKRMKSIRIETYSCVLNIICIYFEQSTLYTLQFRVAILSSYSWEMRYTYDFFSFRYNVMTW